MKYTLLTTILILIAALSIAHEPLKIDRDDPRIIYVNNEIPAEILKAYNEQVALVTELRLKIQELEQELYFTTERLTNLERQVWDMPSGHRPKRAE